MCEEEECYFWKNEITPEGLTGTLGGVFERGERKKKT